MTMTFEAVLWVRQAAGRLLGAGEPAPATDWAAVGEAARRHNLEPLLFELAERDLLSVPPESRATWEGQYYRNQIFNLSLFDTLAGTLEAASRDGAEPVVIKGPVAVARRLGDPGLRVMVDIDLLCRQADLESLVRAAISSGFQAVGENATYHLALQHPELGAGLELHFDLYDVIAERATFIGEVFRNAEQLDLDGRSIVAPSRPADLVLQLAHILQHDQRLDLRHWLDFAQAAMAPLDEAERAELGRLLALSDLEPEFEENLGISGRLFGVEHGLRQEQATQVEPEIWEAVLASLLDLEDTRALLSGARMHPGWWGRASYAARLLVPSPRRWRALAATEGTGVGKALIRHLGRAADRGRRKLANRDRAAAPGESPRARLFERRRR